MNHRRRVFVRLRLNTLGGFPLTLLGKPSSTPRNKATRRDVVRSCSSNHASNQPCSASMRTLVHCWSRPPARQALATHERPFTGQNHMTSGAPMPLSLLSQCAGPYARTIQRLCHTTKTYSSAQAPCEETTEKHHLFLRRRGHFPPSRRKARDYGILTSLVGWLRVVPSARCSRTPIPLYRWFGCRSMRDLSSSLSLLLAGS